MNAKLEQGLITGIALVAASVIMELAKRAGRWVLPLTVNNVKTGWFSSEEAKKKEEKKDGDENPNLSKTKGEQQAS